MDCLPGTSGCCGGVPTDNYKYVVQQGIELESDYPYNKTDGPCYYN